MSKTPKSIKLEAFDPTIPEIINIWPVDHILSNCYPSPVFFDRKHYKSAEHAYHCQKFDPRTQKNIIRRIKNAPTGPEAKAIAEEYETQIPEERAAYSFKLRMMIQIVTAKVVQNPEVWNYLVSTGDALLYEEDTTDPGDDGHIFDEKWGMITNPESGLTEGYNFSARILMRIREKIYNEELQPAF